MSHVPLLSPRLLLLAVWEDEYNLVQRASGASGGAVSGRKSTTEHAHGFPHPPVFSRQSTARVLR